MSGAVGTSQRVQPVAGGLMKKRTAVASQIPGAVQEFSPNLDRSDDKPHQTLNALLRYRVATAPETNLQTPYRQSTASSVGSLGPNDRILAPADLLLKRVLIIFRPRTQTVRAAIRTNH